MCFIESKTLSYRLVFLNLIKHCYGFFKLHIIIIVCNSFKFKSL